MVSVQDDVLDEVPLQDEDTIEFRVLMVYAQRTLPNSKYQELMSRTPAQKKDRITSNGEGQKASDIPSASPKKEKKKSLRQRLTPTCLRPPKEKKKTKLRSVENPDEVRVRGLVQRLTAIVRKLEKQDQESVQFRAFSRMPSIQHDGDGEEDLIADIVAILRAEGDKLNNQIIQEQNLLQRLGALWSYGFFQRLTETYVAQMVPASEPEDVQQSSKIALCVHATTKLTTLDNHPMNRMFGFGARYLKDNYSQWIKEHGGWDKVMGIPDLQEEEESEEE